jgi:Subtilase family
MGIAHGRVEKFEDDQLVIALPDLGLVTRTLADLDVYMGPADRHRDLGLARIRGLANLGAAVRTLLADDGIGTELGRFQGEREGLHPHGVADLDLLLEGIRLRFARDYPGWQVTIGKNHRPSPLHGSPHIDGGNGDPEPAAALPPLTSGPGSGLGRGVRVGLLDTALFPTAWLAGRYLAGPDDLVDPGRGTYTVHDGHCAFVGSCILQQAPAAELHVRHVLDDQGDGSAWGAACAMADIARTGPDVVNLSLGEFFTDDNTAPMVFEAAVKRFSPETVIVAAAGNNGNASEITAEMARSGITANTASYPAALVDVTGVGALDQQGKLAEFTPRPAPWVSLLAPGVGLTGAYVKGDVTIEHKDKGGHSVDKKVVSFDGAAVWEGCSFAAAVVSGAIAARTVPGQRSARQALEELLGLDPAAARRGIVPNN